MDIKELLYMTLCQAKSESISVYPNKIVYVYGNKETNEFTIVSEDNVAKVLEVEPNLKLAAKLLNGEVVK